MEENKSLEGKRKIERLSTTFVGIKKRLKEEEENDDGDLARMPRMTRYASECARGNPCVTVSR